MNVVIRMTKGEEGKALPILLRHTAGAVLPDRTYVLTATAVEALRQAGIRFEELAGDDAAPSLAGASTGERV